MENLGAMKNEPSLQTIRDAYPFLVAESVRFVGRFNSAVPEVPDRTYDVYMAENGTLVTHVITDHPDPMNDSEEFRSMSKGYSFRDIITPGVTSGSIEIVDNDDFCENFFLKDGDTYHYLVNTDYNPVE